MRRSSFLVLAMVLLFSTSLHAQRRVDWPLVASIVAMSVGTGLDVHSTVSCTNPQFCHESNPIAAMFYAPRNPAALYAAAAVPVIGLAMIGSEMKRSRHAFLRKTWWVPSALFTVVSVYSAQRNQQYLDRCSACRR